MSRRGSSDAAPPAGGHDGSSLFPPPLPHRLESMRGPGYTNWVIKRHLLCGPHPGATSTADSVKTLSAILHEGVTAFVALQDEMPSPMVTASIKESALPSKRAQVCARPRACACTRRHACVHTRLRACVQAAYGKRNAITAKPYIDDAQARVAAQRPFGLAGVCLVG